MAGVNREQESRDVSIKIRRKDYDAAQEAEDAWGVWRLTAFPPQVGLNFILSILPEPENAG